VPSPEPSREPSAPNAHPGGGGWGKLVVEPLKIRILPVDMMV